MNYLLSKQRVADDVTLYVFYAVKNLHLSHPNWSEYNASLKQRGSGAIRVNPEVVENWTHDYISRVA